MCHAAKVAGSIGTKHRRLTNTTLPMKLQAAGRGKKAKVEVAAKSREAVAERVRMAEETRAAQERARAAQELANSELAKAEETQAPLVVHEM